VTGRPFVFSSLRVRCDGRTAAAHQEDVDLLTRVAKSVLGDGAQVAREGQDYYTVAFGTRTQAVHERLIRVGETAVTKLLTDTAARWRTEAEAKAKVREASGGEKVILELAPGARRLEPVSIADCWLFVSRELSPLPPFIRELPICGKRLERDDARAPVCGGACVLGEGHDGGCECIADDVGVPGSCPA
jgi:hypothetical protein